MNEQAKVEQLKEQEEVKTALKQTPGTKETIPPPAPELRDKLWFGTYILVLLALLAIYYLLGSDLVPTEADFIPNLRALVLGAISVVITLAVARGIHVYWINQIDNKPARYNLTRALNLLTFLAIIVIGLTVASSNWYTASVSHGVLSLTLGSAP